MWLLAPPAAAATLEVCPTCAYAALEDAVAAALPGDEIALLADVVAPSTVTVDVSVTVRSGGGVTRTLTVQGDPGLALRADDAALRDLVLDADDDDRIVEAAAQRVVLSGLTIRDHTHVLDGAAILVDAGTADVVGCTFTDNVVSGGGAALAVRGTGAVTVTDTVFENQRASQDGGAVHVSDDGSLTLVRATFRGCHADGEGGAVFVDGSGAALSVVDAVFEGNTADDGAAIRVRDAVSARGEGNTFCGDVAGAGAVVRSAADTTSWTRTVHRDGGGVALRVDRGTAVITDDDLLGNVGGIEVDDATADVRNVLVGWSSSVGVALVGGGAVTLGWDAFWRNATDVAGLPDLGPNAVTTDPLVGYTPGGPCDEDLSRGRGSPLLGAGDPSLDPDIGAGVVAPPADTSDTGVPGHTGGGTPTGGTGATGGTGGSGGRPSPAGPPPDPGCGCAASPGVGPVGWSLVLAAAVARRRRGDAVR